MTNYLCNDAFEIYEECKEEMLMDFKKYNDIPENEDVNEEFGKYLMDCIDQSIEDFLITFKGENLMVVGIYGRWNGKFDVCKPIENAQKLINFLSQWDYYKLYEENNKIKIECADHDGSSYFELKQLRKKYQYEYEDIIEELRPNLVDKFFKRISKKEMENFLN